MTVEFPHLLRLIEENQFDTIYHEHFSYFSFVTARAIFAAHGLARVRRRRAADARRLAAAVCLPRREPRARVTGRVEALAERERQAGYRTLGRTRASATGSRRPSGRCSSS